VTRTLSATARQWLRRFHPTDHGGPALVCFPHAGGSATAYRPLSAAVSAVFDTAVVQYPGRQDRLREAARTDLTAMADEITDVLLEWSDGRDYVLFGHSMGAVLAFEAARRLPREAAVRAVVVSGQRAPSRPRPREVHRGSEDVLRAEIARLGGTDPRLLDDPDLMRTVLPTVRADYTAAETYRCDPGATVPYPLVVCCGTADPEVTSEEAEAWRQHAPAGCRVHYFPGGHFYLDDQLPGVADVLIDSAVSSPPPRP
jgi:surfactin synthase thioesterase subunit